MMDSRRRPGDSLERQLLREVRGEVRFDPTARFLYATDASIYQIEPIGVVCPLDRADVAAAVGVAAAAGVPILPRGGGTSLVGQTVGRALVLDLSRHMHRIVAVDPVARTARVEPGVVLSELNRHVRAHGLMFGPDVAPANRACVGGMIGNNSCGAHSVVYGKTVDHVERLDVVLADGTCVELARDSGDDRVRELERAVGAVVARYRQAVERDYPAVMRRVMGYNLDAFAADRNLAGLIVGSEGTLATVVEATVGLVPIPAERQLLVLHYPDIFRAADQVPAFLSCEPSAVELVDPAIVRLARESPEYAGRTHFAPAEPAALLLLEASGETRAEVAAKIAALRVAAGGTPHVHLEDRRQDDVWTVRRAGLAILMRMRGDRKPIGFVEDTAVDPARLGEYLRRFDRIVTDHRTRAVYYGHASVGCIHIRPILDLFDEQGVDTMRAIAIEVASLVREFGGALSGEHGDGLTRSPWIETMLGPELARAFGEVKAIFDPQGLMNPGKIVAAEPFGHHLRHDAGVRRAIDTRFDFTETGGLLRALELCNGNGMCRKLDGGTMCPSYMITREEEHSTRGRANLLRAFYTGQLAPQAAAERAVTSALDLCLSCKACRRECPSGVDMTRLKMELLAARHARRGPPLADRLYGHVRRLLALSARTPRLARRLAGNRQLRWLVERVTGLDRRRSLPLPRAAPWRQLVEPRLRNGADHATVVLFDDTFTTFLEPELGEAALALLEAAGEVVKLPDAPVCCGRALLSRGLVDEARRSLARLLDVLAPDLEAGRPVIGLEPSCLLTFRDELPALFPGDRRAALLRERALLFDEHLRGRARALGWRSDSVEVMVHTHCHREALAGPGNLLELLTSLPGVTARRLDSGCCGMAGSFGYDHRHFDLSMAIGERLLLRAVREAAPETVIVAEGTSCRHQIADGGGRQALHPARFLAARLAGAAAPGDAP